MELDRSKGFGETSSVSKLVQTLGCLAWIMMVWRHLPIVVECIKTVNYRVLDRKLRLKPLGRRHVCLDVTHCVAHSKKTKETKWECSSCWFLLFPLAWEYLPELYKSQLCFQNCFQTVTNLQSPQNHNPTRLSNRTASRNDHNTLCLHRCWTGSASLMQSSYSRV